ncbi:MAG: ATP synthase F0 subunit A [Elusimicrobia bacterium CG08_land_8_20_14_0_20_51_18]|nr:MAG: ATP synthase F0 subunit A [Elusimicrobia bacterium CG08_land_8_20_14_0_20_51_18]
MELKEILEHHIIDHVYDWINVSGLKLPFSKHLLMMAIASSVLLFVFPVIVRSRIRFLSPVRSMLEIILIFIRDEIVLPNLGSKGAGYLHYFATLFFFILVMNLLGFIPFGSTATGNIAVTLAMALTTFVLVNFAGIRAQGPVSYLKHLVPSGVPSWLYPLLFPIELIGMFTKTFALAIRLFANMIAGHIVILVFISFIFIFGSINLYLGLFVTAPVSVLLVIFISLLELFVAFLQAYVFTFLTAIFTGAAMHPH